MDQESVQLFRGRNSLCGNRIDRRSQDAFLRGHPGCEAEVLEGSARSDDSSFDGAQCSGDQR
ncbi:MAG: hypothetical protein K0Q61_1780, partial [Rhodococcus erythropolis]|nr:hypothetical protein [Rhodococcus erythropolis]